MVEVACRTPVPVGVIAWPGYHAAATLIVKATFDLRPDGSVTLSPEQQPLSLEVRAGDGTLVYPNDFAPHKTLVDVIVVGEEARATSKEVSLALGAFRVTGEHLGPVVGHDPREQMWSSAGFDLTRFQAAPPAQRLARILFPAELAYVRENVMLRQLVDFPMPSLTIVERGTGEWSSDEALSVPLICDTVLVDPRARTLTLLHRGFAELSEGFGPDTLVLVNPFGRLDGVKPGDIISWPRAKLVVFEEVAGLAGAASFVGDGVESSTVDDSRETPLPPAPLPEAVSAPAAVSARKPANTQPMSTEEVARAMEETRRKAQAEAGMAPPAPSAPPPPYGPPAEPSMRATAAMPAGLGGPSSSTRTPFSAPTGTRGRAVVTAPPPAPRFGAPPPPPSTPHSGPFGRTQSVPVYSPHDALPFVQGRFEPKPAPAARPDEVDGEPIHPAASASTLPFSRGSQMQAIARAITASAPAGGTLTMEQIRAIRDEIAAAPGARAEILARHGLSEAAWRTLSGGGPNA